jgi:hypothetical protein
MSAKGNPICQMFAQPFNAGLRQGTTFLFVAFFSRSHADPYAPLRMVPIKILIYFLLPSVTVYGMLTEIPYCK